MSSPIALFKVRTIIAAFHGCKNVSMRWIAVVRSTPSVPYAEAIADFQPLGEAYAKGWIDELFTAEEKDALISYLAMTHPDEQHSFEKVELPVSGSLFPISAMPTGGPQGSYNLCRIETNGVPVDVVGYYDLRAHEPLPDRESDLRRRKAFASGTFYVIAGSKVINAADLEEIEPLH
ncbi:hypothetical protein [Mesorhizobium sp. M0254]|uniref:hypothetical protein n=1 Tax=Mesorhizobium sp. M0254 TaxID=2956927 RepID=UPI00333C1D2B